MCDFCKGITIDMVKSDDCVNVRLVNKNDIGVGLQGYGGSEYVEFEINYCPFCGKLLNDEVLNNDSN